MSSAPPTAASGVMEQEVGLAVRNGTKLALSLLCTWSVTLLVRFQLPRFLGPEEFGAFNFSDSFAASFFAFLDLGVDVYIQKEVSVRPKYASEFWGGVLVLRGAIAIVLAGAMLSVLRITARPREVQLAALVFAAGYLAQCVNSTFSALLQAATRVGWLAIANVLGKVMWGLGLVACMWSRRPMVAFAVPMLASEAVRFAMLWPSARRAVDLRFRIDWAAVKRAVIESLPYFISSAAIAIAVRINVSTLEFLVKDRREVGWLGAAANLGSLAMLMSPLFSWIIMPMLARARQRSTDDVFRILRFGLEGLLVVAIPVSLLIGIGADLWVKIAFGARYAQAALSLIAVAPQFIFTYTAMILSMGLIILDQQWKATRNSLMALVLTPLFIVSIVPLSAHLGEGGAAAGAASAVVLSEIFVSASCLYCVGWRAVGRRTLAAASKSAGIALGVIALDHVLRPLGFVRIGIDMAVYGAAALGSGAIRVRDASWVLRSVRHRHPPSSLSSPGLAGPDSGADEGQQTNISQGPMGA